MIRSFGVLVALCLPVIAATKLAVIGDSISTGAHAKQPGFNGYPARLGHLLGEDYEVRAFALSGHTLLRKTPVSVMNKPIYQEALRFKPDVAVVMLGTNDSSSAKRPFWQYHEDLRPDLLAMIADLRKANPAVMIHLAGPPPMYPEKKGITADRAADLAERRKNLQVLHRVFRQVASEESRVVIHDLARVFTAEETSDGVHPDTFAHRSLAEYLAEVIETPFDEEFSIKEKIVDPKVGDFHGYRRLDFRLGEGGPAAIVVVPRQASEGRPWIWRARFFGHQSALDLQLLDRGWHVAYCDVSNLYGSDTAMNRWHTFYQFMTEAGLSKKPVLEGMSRGGLPIFRWASLHPGKVAAVYGDNPVCDFRTWPGGDGGKRSDSDWMRLLKAWQISEEHAKTHPQVVDWLAPMAKARVPVALVIGMADEVVPAAPNGLAVADRYTELGGSVRVWTKPGSGHHPHGLRPPDALRRWLMKAAGFERNPSVIATPSSEYRAGAGWGNDSWQGAFKKLKEVGKANSDAEIVFLGDSITQGLTGHADRVARQGGTRAIDRYFGDRKALSFGLSGDRTQHLIWRIKHGQFDGLSPEWVVLMIGVNNINAGGETGEETLEGTKAVVTALRESVPQSKILVLGSLPAGKDLEDPRRLEIEILQQGITSLADGKVVFHEDLTGLFLDQDGRHNANMSGDQIHITPAGQEAWMKALAPRLKKAL